MRNISVLIACLAIYLLGGAEAARLYKWVDESGNVSYHDRPPPDDGSYRVEQKDFKTQLGERSEEEKLRDTIKNFPVTLYTVNTCANCDLVRDYLGKHNIPFTEKNVHATLENNKELQALTGSVIVPTLKIGKKAITGFTYDQIETELAQAGYPVVTVQEEQEEQDVTGQQ